MKLLICAGGTGGGVNPALAVLQHVRHQADPVETLWIGSLGGMEADLVKREGIAFEAIPAAGVHGVGWRSLPRNLWKLFQGLWASHRVLKRFQPDVIFFTGGYLAVPMALAAWFKSLFSRIGLRRGQKARMQPKSLLYVPDIEPGLALKTLARLSGAISVTADESCAYFRNRKVTVTGYPVRESIKILDMSEARQALGLRPDLPTLLVTGGSTGARSINRALMLALPELLKELQVIHLTGKLDWPEVKAFQDGLSPALQGNYHAFAYLHEEMGAAFSVADLVISRAGASTLGEYPLFGIPAILVPYPYSWQYQRVNAGFLKKHGAALVIEDADLPTKLLPLIRDLVQDPYRMNQMRDAMRTLYRPQAAASIAGLLRGLVVSQKDVAYG